MTKLYKFRPFGINSLSELCNSEVYFSNPKNFNDPLDCSPTLINDICLSELEKLCHRMLSKNYSLVKADSDLHDLRYQSTEHGDYRVDQEVQENYKRNILAEIKRQLDIVMKSKGVLSMATQWKSPLMWSHYADEHKGICIEYDVSQSALGKPKKVDYLGGRGIYLSQLIDYIFNASEKAKEAIEHKYFYTKAGQWSYEEEWRYTSETQGINYAPFPISAIYFGMRCDRPVVSSIVKLLNGSNSNINFYQVYADHNSFELHERSVDIEELIACTPRPSPVLEFFNSLGPK